MGIKRRKPEEIVTKLRQVEVLRGLRRSTQGWLLVARADEVRLVADMIELARQYGRYIRQNWSDDRSQPGADIAI